VEKTTSGTPLQKIIDSKNIGSLYSFVTKKLPCKKGVGALRDEQGNTVTKDESQANLLNAYFSSVCVKDDGTSPNFTRAVPDSMSIDNVYFTPTKAKAAIKKMKPSKSSGPDNFSSFSLSSLSRHWQIHLL